MMEKLHRQPDVTRQDYCAFVNELKLFHQNRGTPFRHLPKINGREIDLLKFYNQVTALGGLQKVIDHDKWDSVSEVLKLPKCCVNFALSLRQIYIRYLGHYEKIHFMGEEPEHEKNQSTDSHNRKLQLTLFHHVPMVYNVSQHEVTDAARSTSGLNRTFVAPTDYDKLCMSLLCGLPNEQELTLNVCTILSNEGNYMLHLEQAPKLVDLLIAQAGIWPLGDSSLKLLYLESWKDIKGRDIFRFWRSFLNTSNPELLELLGLDLGTPDPDGFLNTENDLGALNVEGQRVLRVALILHNLSFERNNVPVLVSNFNFIRFLLLSIHTSWADLKQITYDTLANIAPEIKLSIERDQCSRILFQTVMDGILSPDRYMNIRSMDILSQLCNLPPNEDIIPSRLDIEVYQKMVQFLTVHDVMLLFYTLEAIYALSDLGRYACDKIVCVHRCIGILVSLLTLDPGQYGSSGQIKMKIVETVSYDMDEEKSSTSFNANSLSSVASPSVKTDVDSETFVNNWLKSTYESASGSMVSRNEIYAEYVSFCGKSGRKSVVNANVFAVCVKNIFPHCGLKRIESGSGVITFHHDGLKKKKFITSQTSSPISKSTNFSPTRKVPVTPPSNSCAPGKKPSHSPILKAQLSAPPRNEVTSPPLKRTVNATNESKCASSSHVHISQNSILSPQAASATTGSSTLIKSLLANKVQQRNLQRHVVPQNVSRMVIYSPDKVVPINKGIVGSPTTVVRCIRPGGLSQSNIRTPIQARFVSHKGSILTTNPQVIKPNAPLSSRMKNAIIKQNFAPATISTQLNGVKTEVSNHHDDFKSEVLVHNSTTHLNSLQVDSESSLDTKDSISCDEDSSLVSKVSDLNSNSQKNFLLSGVRENSLNSRLSTLNMVSTPSNILSARPKIPSDGLCLNKDQQNGSSVAFVNKSSTSDSISQPSFHPKAISPSSIILKSVLNDLDPESEGLTKLQLLQKEKICKKAPLLNGLLDKGKLTLSEDSSSNIFIQNGNLSNPPFELHNSSDNKFSFSSVQTTTNQCSTPNSQNSSMAVSSDSSSSSLSNTIPTLNSVNASTLNSKATSVSTSNSTISVCSNLSSPSIIPETSFHSNGDSLMEICTGQTTLSGTIEVQPDQKGVVRLHIESPENSNQGSDLSSISDIARTLECASKAISRTNAECSTQVPYCGTCETTATVTVITTNTPTLARTGQQFIVVTTPALNQPQLHIQSPNIKFRILHTIPKSDNSVDFIGFPKVVDQLTNLKQPASETPSITSATLKRPSSDSSICVTADVKKPRIDTKTPLLKATLRLPTPVPCSIASATSVNAKSFHDIQPFLLKSSQMDSLGSSPKLTSAKAVPVQNVDLPSEREIKTFSGLSSASDNPSLSSPPQETPKSLSSAKLEYICEWKDCGLKFPNPGSVFLHASKTHTPFCTEDMICQWESCDSMKRRRFSLLTHLQDWHCNERVLHIQALRRKQLSLQGKTSIAPPQMPPSHPGYAPDAALLAIRRHALQYVNPKELSEEKESALTKSIRLTSALILRNLVTHSSLARTYIKRFEQELAYLAMSPVESARTIAQCLSELSRSHD